MLATLLADVKTNDTWFVLPLQSAQRQDFIPEDWGVPYWSWRI
jgi:hypothetical protein